jgi:hypothetical protein
MEDPAEPSVAVHQDCARPTLMHTPPVQYGTSAYRSAKLGLSLVAAALTLFATTPAFADAPPRVRGVVTEVDNGSITLKERTGRLVTLSLGADTAYAYVVPAYLHEIKVNDFVGAAVKGTIGSMIAVELVIIPDSMRAGRISFYGWDPLPDPTTELATEISTATSMTNGLVSNVVPATSKITNTSMTNGVVSAKSGAGAGLALEVRFVGSSKSYEIAVPPRAPITRFEASDRTAVTVGSNVFVKTDPGNKAGLVAVGEGIIPPM